MISLKKPEFIKKLPSAIIDSRGYVLRKKVVSKELDKLIQEELIVKPELTNEFGQSDYKVAFLNLVDQS